MRGDLAVGLQHLGCLVHGVAEQSPVGPGHRVQPVGEGGDHAEVAAPAAQRPEQVGMGVSAGLQNLPVRGDDLRAEQVVARQPGQPVQPADPAAERQPGDASGADHSAGGGQPELTRGGVQLAPQHAGRDGRGAGGRVNPDRFHAGQVEHQRVVGDGEARRGMPAAADADRQAVLTSEAHRRDDVACAGSAGDQRRAAVDRAVPHRARRVVPFVTRRDQSPAEVIAKPVHSGPGQCRHRASFRRHRQLCGRRAASSTGPPVTVGNLCISCRPDAVKLAAIRFVS